MELRVYNPNKDFETFYSIKHTINYFESFTEKEQKGMKITHYYPFKEIDGPLLWKEKTLTLENLRARLPKA